MTVTLEFIWEQCHGSCIAPGLRASHRPRTERRVPRSRAHRLLLLAFPFTCLLFVCVRESGLDPSAYALQHRRLGVLPLSSQASMTSLENNAEVELVPATGDSLAASDSKVTIAVSYQGKRFVVCLNDGRLGMRCGVSVERSAYACMHAFVCLFIKMHVHTHKHAIPNAHCCTQESYMLVVLPTHAYTYICGSTATSCMCVMHIHTYIYI